MARQHHIIYVPGLHDQHVFNRSLTKFLPRVWKSYGFYGHILAPHWEEGSSFRPKLDKIVRKIDTLSKQGHIVSLIGQSAGGSAVLNAFCERKKVVNGVINATGRLRKDEHIHPSLLTAARRSRAFGESVLLFEHVNERSLSEKDLQKIMTIRPFWDEIVPASTVPLVGATNRVIPVPEHSLGGIYIVIFFAKQLFDFLQTLASKNE